VIDPGYADTANKIAAALLNRLDLIDGNPPYFTRGFKGGIVKRGLTSTDLNGTQRPLAALLMAGRTQMLKTASRHDKAHRWVVHVETAPRQDADAYLWALIDDMERAWEGDERLGGLLLRPLYVADVVAVVDLDADPPVGSAELHIDAVYRVAH
jgi:hypothetical protein